MDQLLETIDRLLAPDGCPWDREQTLESMRHQIIEETYELVEAIDWNQNPLIEEELGDLLFIVLFLCRLTEKENRFNLKAVIAHLHAKLIRRHPHIFGEAIINSSAEVIIQWENIKKQEVKAQPRESALDGIPKDLPALARGQKIAKKLARTEFTEQKDFFSHEEEAGERLWTLLKEMAGKGIQAEEALRKRLSQVESDFRQWEKERAVGKSLVQNED